MYQYSPMLLYSFDLESQNLRKFYLYTFHISDILLSEDGLLQILDTNYYNQVHRLVLR
jgi:hypothetical protein